MCFPLNTSAQCKSGKKSVNTDLWVSHPQQKVRRVFLSLLYCKLPKKLRISPTICYPRARNHSWLENHGLVNTQKCHYAGSFPCLHSPSLSFLMCKVLICRLVVKSIYVVLLLNPIDVLWLDALLIQQLARKEDEIMNNTPGKENPFFSWFKTCR